MSGKRSKSLKKGEIEKINETVKLSCGLGHKWNRCTKIEWKTEYFDPNITLAQLITLLFDLLMFKIIAVRHPS